ncbi:MAG: anti-sigma factor, partial [Chloroflexi bacterium]
TPDAPLPRWRLYLALGLIVITSLLSIVGAAYFYQILWLPLGIDMILTQLEAWPDRFLQMLYTMVPFAREVISIAALIRDQLHWILLAVILWILLDAAQSEHQLAHNQ